MLKLSFNSKFWAVVGLQVLILVSVLFFTQIQFVAGERVLLKLVPPSDPLSLFQGHYLRLNYEISQLNSKEIPRYYNQGFSEFKTGDKIYVALSKQGNYWKAYQISRSRPKQEIVIKGTVISNSGKLMGIEYGIESYFIPEENWQEIERVFRGLQRDQNVFVEVSISELGTALIRKIFVDKKEIDVSNIKQDKERFGPIKAQDARVISNIAQARTVMVYIYANDGNYDEFTCQQEDMRMICEEISNSGGWMTITYDAQSNAQAVCVYSPLRNKPNYWYCADSSGNAGLTEIFPGGAGYCVDGRSSECPPVEQ